MFTYEDIEDAIYHINLDSTPGPDGVPAIRLKRCGASSWVDIIMLCSESMSSGVVPLFNKTGYVTPLSKKGSRGQAGNCRAVTHTSHFVRVFKMMARKNIVLHLKTSNLVIATNQTAGEPSLSYEGCRTNDHWEDEQQGEIKEQLDRAAWLFWRHLRWL